MGIAFWAKMMLFEELDQLCTKIHLYLTYYRPITGDCGY